jgi:hypothetical protein
MPALRDEGLDVRSVDSSREGCGPRNIAAPDAIVIREISSIHRTRAARPCPVEICP